MVPRSTTSAPTHPASPGTAPGSPGTTPTSAAIPSTSTVLPPADAANRLIHRAGTASRDAQRVEVSFAFNAPAAHAFWAKDSRSGIDIALGKAGGHQAPAPDARPRDVAARPDRRADGLGQVDPDARPHHQPRAELQSGRDRPLPDRLQEGGRVQGLRHAQSAPRERRGDRERAPSSASALCSGSTTRCASAASGSADAGVQDIQGYRNAPGTPPCPALPSHRR